MQRPCIGAGAPCPTRALTTHRSGRCPECARRHYSRLYATSRSGHNDRRWRQFRLTILQRDNYVCFHCGGAAVEVDHLVPVSVDPTREYDPTNCVASCAHDNRSRGARLDD
jgi:5-methylcytosine-specific restriction endonuclease McrA